MTSKLTTYLLISSFLIITTGYTQDEKENKPVFDPNTLNEPELTWPTVMHPLLPVEDLEIHPEKSPGSDQLVSGYRVQVMATRFYEKADSLRSVLTEYFGQEVYIDFEAPNYKVRVGNCLVRSQAEDLQKELENRGYSSAWIIRTRVYAE